MIKNKKLDELIIAADKYHQYLLIPLIIIYLSKAWRHFQAPFFSPDAENYYIPYAKRLLSEGPSLLFEKSSLILAPGTYIWPALLGGNPSIIRPVNMFLGVLMLLLFYDIGKILYSKFTGLASAFLFSISSVLIFWIPSLISEPPFIFFSLLFIWAILKVSKKNNWAIPICMLALTSSILIRPVWLYPSSILLITSPAIYFYIKGREAKLIFKKIILSLVLGLAIPMAFISYNQAKYKLPGIAVGSGNALFYGTNVFTGGFEPPIIHLGYGVGSYGYLALEKKDFIEQDKNLVGVAKEQLKNRSLKDFFYWVATKFSWFNFFTPLDAGAKSTILRILEFSFSLLGFIWALKEKKYLIIALGFAYILQVGQAIPALYNIRYSVGNLEPLLIILAPIGIIALFTTFNQSKSTFLVFSFFVAAFFSTGLYAHFKLLPKVLFPENMTYEILYENINPKTTGQTLWTMELPKIVSSTPLNTFIKVGITSDATAEKCGSINVIFNKKIINVIDFKNILRSGNDYFVIMGARTSSDNFIPDTPTTLTLDSACIVTGEITKISYVRAEVKKYWLPNE